jgi:hypothetical protein
MTLILINLLLLGLTLYFADVLAKSNLKTWVVLAFIYFCWSIINLERVKWAYYIEQEFGETRIKVEFRD